MRPRLPSLSSARLAPRLVSGLGIGTRRLAAALLLGTACGYGPSAVAADPPEPSIDLQPAEVVEIVVDALRRNPGLEDDAGIRTVFRFASPGNRAMTGPVERFATMIKRGYGDMLGFASSRFEDIEVERDTALQVVWLRQEDGRESGYAFQLGRQSGGEYDGMWMTDAVLPLGESAESGTSI